MVMQRYDPPKEYYIVRSTGVKKMLVTVAEWEMGQRMTIRGYVWSNNMKRWSKTLRDERPFGDRCYTTKDAADRAYQEFKKRLLEVREREMEIARNNLRKAKRP
jgi:hypothetical protein